MAATCIVLNSHPGSIVWGIRYMHVSAVHAAPVFNVRVASPHFDTTSEGHGFLPKLLWSPYMTSVKKRGNLVYDALK